MQSSLERCSVVQSSGLCGNHSDSSNLTLAHHVFMELAMCTEALLCYNSLGKEHMVRLSQA